ncbi:ABC transporter permease [Pseudoroseicyclus tamaricis]|uniref:ABC transporter permease subunit n=1 Tax=Pseudoroseicyclus tamaricis TaxID=2705421 RepID=A0A6B2JVS4_9RHOB|nr:ABC transporter permease subunit [Pseudoroseicyclus tamaricis]NDV02378.1 ABC transporter permease subunit [Pseudoroseicyclus tamaricis]
MRRAPTLLLLAPVLLVLVPLFGGALLFGAARSLGHMPEIGMDGWSLAPWREVLTDPQTWRALALSLWIAAAATALSLVAGTALALGLARPFRGAGLARLLVQVNLTVPHLLAGAGVLLLLSQSGLAARGAAAFGWIDAPAEFPALVWDRAAAGTIAAYVVKEVPFVTLLALSTLASLGPGPVEAARTTGASRWQALRFVTLPALAPTLSAAGAITFAFAFGAYELPALLGASHPLALPVLAWQKETATSLTERPEAMALALMTAAVAAGLVGLVARARR